MEGVTVEALGCGTTDFSCLSSFCFRPLRTTRSLPHTVQSSQRTAIVNYSALAATRFVREEIRLTSSKAKSPQSSIIHNFHQTLFTVINVS